MLKTMELLNLMDEILEKKNSSELSGEPPKKEFSTNISNEQQNGSALSSDVKFEKYHTWQWREKNDRDLGTTIELQLKDYGKHIQKVFINTMKYVEDFFPEDSKVDVQPNTLCGIIFIDIGRVATNDDRNLLIGLKQDLTEKYYIITS